MIPKLLFLRTLTVLILFSFFGSTSFAGSKLFTVKEGDPLMLLQPKKTAVFEIDYSKMMVTEGKDHEDDVDFATWMKMQDEDDDKWMKDWRSKDSASCDKAFRDNFNDEVKDGIKLTKLGKDYKVILKFTLIDFGPAVKYGGLGIQGGEAKADGELEVRDLETNDVLLIIGFHQLKGESSFKQIGRLKGLFENLGEELSEYLEDYQKEYEKLQKKLKKKKK